MYVHVVNTSERTTCLSVESSRAFLFLRTKNVRISQSFVCLSLRGFSALEGRLNESLGRPFESRSLFFNAREGGRRRGQSDRGCGAVL